MSIDTNLFGQHVYYRERSLKTINEHANSTSVVKAITDVLIMDGTRGWLRILIRLLFWR